MQLATLNTGNIRLLYPGISAFRPDLRKMADVIVAKLTAIRPIIVEICQSEPQRWIYRQTEPECPECG